jgi:hypothetical protein
MASLLRILCSAPRSRPGERSGRPLSTGRSVNRRAICGSRWVEVVNRIFAGTRLVPSNVLTDAEDGLLMLTLASHSGPYPTCPSTFA